ncbi:RCC1 domain-containing protein 1-like isoform X5 [Stegostoma tigrinum]|uniref:RCC1 domain-containing protein 1-like isoform X5 n=1 Tax=Stegostoma tigrinum TaxID=3053191 RepID=UPI00202AFCE2|nr:RCC1 domain-containing protein 1-like isoform X5 [Stegostoma tigrinum]
MVAMPGRWFGFGFNQFGQVVNRRECEGDGKVLGPVAVTVHSLGKAGQWPSGGSCLRKLSPAWSHTACLAALPLIPDGYVTTTLPFYKPLAPQLCTRKLALGSEHAVLLSTGFTVYSWGSGRHGQLGHGGVEDETEPRIVEALHGLAMAEIAAGGWHSVCSSVSGDLYVWGWNESGQLGLPAKSCSEEKHRKTPQQKRLSGEVSPSLSEANNTVIKSANKITGLGDSNVFISIQAFPALLDLPEELEVSKVSCGSRHSAAVTREGKLFTWGWAVWELAQNQQLGDLLSYHGHCFPQCFPEHTFGDSSLSWGSLFQAATNTWAERLFSRFLCSNSGCVG